MKKVHYENILEREKTNMKNTWRILNNVIQKNVIKQEFPDTFKKTTKLSKIKSKSQLDIISILQLSVLSWQNKLINQQGMKVFICICKTDIQNRCL